MTVAVQVLGPVEAWISGRPVALGPAKQRAVLCALAMDAGQPVSVASLIDRVWSHDPPPTARETIYAYMARLRRLLATVAGDLPATAGKPAVTESPIVRRGGGYCLDVDPGAVDAHRFRRLVTFGTDASHPEAEREAALRQALDLWAGTALAGITGPWADRLRSGLEQRRIGAVVAWSRLQLRRGEPAAVIEEAEPLAAAHPLVEPLAAVLIEALYALGRRGPAQELYESVCRALAQELGVDPGPELRDLRHRLLDEGAPAAGPDSVPPVRANPQPPARAGRPAQLPSDVHGFTGRARELQWLDDVLAAPGDVTAVVISALSGTAGVGKTAIAVRWAHGARSRFPDGQLYVNLRGYDPDQPMRPADALAGFLTALGVPDGEVPLELDDRMARFRTEVAGRRLLVVLDNAASADQVRPLLPGSPTCTVLVTSRDSLAGLVARDGAHRLDLDLLPLDESVTLLRRLVGGRVDAEPDAAATLAEQCARLPLALRVAAELAVARQGVRLADLAGELADRQRRLELLDVGGDPYGAVRAVFSWSVRHLPADVARMFALLGLHPGPDLDAYAAAALADVGLAPARRALDRLARANLAQVTAAGRYAMHDLLRAYAVELVEGTGEPAGDVEIAADEARRAVGRLFDYYLGTAAAAMDCLYPAESHRRPRVPLAPTPMPDVDDLHSARAWLDDERHTLVGVAAQATRRGHPDHAVKLSATLFRYLDGGRYSEALTIHGHAREAARQCGDLSGEAQGLMGLGTAALRLGRLESAAEHYDAALALFRQLGDQLGQARALGNLGNIEQWRGRQDVYAEYQRQALTLYRRLGDRPGEARCLGNLGSAEARLGDFGAAAEHCEQGLALFRAIDDQSGVGCTLDNLGRIELRLGRHDRAADYHQQALVLFRALGDRSGEAWSEEGLATVHTRLGHIARAVALHQRALAGFRESGERDGECRVLNGLGEAAVAAGDPEDALAHHDAALAIALDIGDREQQARAHDGIGQAWRGLGDAALAADHYERAIASYDDLGLPDADDVRTRLAAVGRGAAAPA